MAIMSAAASPVVVSTSYVSSEPGAWRIVVPVGTLVGPGSGTEPSGYIMDTLPGVHYHIDES